MHASDNDQQIDRWRNIGNNPRLILPSLRAIFCKNHIVLRNFWDDLLKNSQF